MKYEPNIIYFNVIVQQTALLFFDKNKPKTFSHVRKDLISVLEDAVEDYQIPWSG